MSNTLTPLEWDASIPATAATRASAHTAAPTADKLGRDAFAWPTPPYSSYQIGRAHV